MAGPTPIPTLAVHPFGRAERSAPTLVLLHGVTDSGLAWGDAVRRWSGAYRILAVDALGHGASPRYTRAQLQSEPAEHMYAATVAVIERLTDRDAPPVLVGHSMGGAMAGAVAARRPDLVRAAVLEDPAWLPPLTAPAEEAAAHTFVTEQAAVRADPVAALAAGRTAHPTWPEEELGPWVQATLDTDPAFLATGAVVVRDPWPELVRALARPVLVITGTEGTIIGRIRPMLDAVAHPAVEVSVVEGAGHCVRRDRREAYHAIVDPWIERQFAPDR